MLYSRREGFLRRAGDEVGHPLLLLLPPSCRYSVGEGLASMLRAESLESTELSPVGSVADTAFDPASCQDTAAAGARAG